jgi:hypothetical protein
MDWIFEVSDAEREAGALTEESAVEVLKAFRLRGVAILRGVFSQKAIDRFSDEFTAQFGHLDPERLRLLAKTPPPNPLLKVGKSRYDSLPEIKGALADPALIANPIFLPLVRKVLGEFVRMAGFTIVISCPGAEEQKIHRDHPQLFTETHLGTVLPPYAMNVSIPLVDVDLGTGPTGLWLGSHLWPDSGDEKFRPVPETMTQVPFQRGDCVLLDYRLHHAGLANCSELTRPLLYLVYARSWFYDEINHKERRSLNMAMATYEALPSEVQQLMLRIKVDAMRAAPTNLAAPIPTVPA